MTASLASRRDRSCPCGTVWLDSDDVRCPECRRDPDERRAEIAAVVPAVDELVRRRSGFPGNALATTTAEIVELAIRTVDARRATVAPGDQPPPEPNDGISVHGAVIVHLVQRPGAVYEQLARDLDDRRRVGIERYGVALQPHNGRDAAWDGYQEALDGLAYVGQLVCERSVPGPDGCPPEIDALFAAQLAACEAWARLVHPELAEPA